MGQNKRKTENFPEILAQRMTVISWLRITILSQLLKGNNEERYKELSSIKIKEIEKKPTVRKQ